MTNVLVDFVGHADLFYSMHALFEKRLGFKMYRPLLSAEWDRENIVTASFANSQQECLEQEEGVFTANIETHSYTQNCISFDKFLSTDIDIIVTTSWENERPLAELIKKYKSNAKFIRVIANIHEKPVITKNILLSTKEPMPAGTNWMKYHGEHRELYSYTPLVSGERSIKSFFNYMSSYPVEIANWNFYKASLPEFIFKMHGGLSEDGSIPQNNLHEVMKSSMFIWHCKPHGGCGFTARQALACGRPLIVNKRYCAMYNTLAQDYLQDGINCIDIDPNKRKVEDSLALIRTWSQPGVIQEKCLEVKSFFEKTINFEAEALAIKDWLNRL